MPATFGCQPSPHNQGAQVAGEVFGGGENLEIVQHPTRVEASRLLIDNKLRMDAELANYPMVGEAIDVPTQVASRVAGVLAAEESYLWGFAKACVPTYGVRISFLQNDQRIDVLFCFECDLITVLRNGRVVGGGNIDPARQSLLRDVKELFPNDEAIQALDRDIPSALIDGRADSELPSN